jgi:hypothetical protein
MSKPSANASLQDVALAIVNDTDRDAAAERERKRPSNSVDDLTVVRDAR